VNDAELHSAAARIFSGTMQLKSDAEARVAATPPSPVLAGKPNGAPKVSRDEGVASTFCDGASQPRAACFG
jgi:hypothetical protein